MSRPVWFCVGVWLTSVALTGRVVSDPPMTVTTDTQAYCLSLARLMDRTPQVPPEARGLASAGRTLCGQGHVRGGLLRLRRAVLLTQGAAR